MPNASPQKKAVAAKSIATASVATVLLGLAGTGPAVAENATQPTPPSQASSTNISAVENAIQDLKGENGDIISVETSEADAFKAVPSTGEKPVTGGDNPGAVMGQSLRDKNNVGYTPESSKQLLKQVAAATSDETLKENIEEKIDATANPANGAAAYTTWKPGGIQGMDVSGHQPVINWTSQWNMGARFAYVKATEGTYYKSEAFGDQYSASYNAGMIRGAYHFAYPEVGTGASQADYFINNGGGWSADGKTLPGLLDVEYNPYGQICYNMSQAQMRTWIQQFSDRYKQRTGRLPAIYSTTNWWKSCTGNTTMFNDHPLHIAAYNNVGAGELFAGRTNYDIWQYSDSGPFAGDSNQFAGSSAKLTDLAKNRNYTPIGGRAPAGATTAPAPKPAAPTSSYAVKGGIATKYKALGGAAKLGSPTGNEVNRGDGVITQTFKLGTKVTTIYWKSGYPTTAVEESGDIYAKWKATGWLSGYGYPMTAKTTIPGGYSQQFKKGGTTTTIYWSAATGSKAMTHSGDIYNKWVATGGLRGYGFPTAEKKQINGGYVQSFRNGSTINHLYWSPSTGAQPVKGTGAIGGKFAALKYETGVGWPTGPEKSEGNGVVSQTFKKGTTTNVIYWKSGEPTTMVNVTGAIGNKWRSLGGLSKTGYPITDEVSRGDGIISQTFKNGTTATTVYWKSGKTTMAMTETGDIFKKFQASGGVGTLGMPITEKILNSDGGYTQKFQRGSTVSNILWTRAANARIVKETGGIGKEWVNGGREKGRYGYPTTDEVQSGTEVYQKFSKGYTLHWSTTQASGWVTK